MHTTGLSRRTVLSRGATAAAAATLAVTVTGNAPASAANGAARGGGVPFHGSHQAGVTTDAQLYATVAAFDVTTDRGGLKKLLDDWTAAGAEIAANDASRFTMTVGFGPSLFDHRFGLTGRCAALLAPLPGFPGDRIDPSTSNGDLFVQLCSDDRQVLNAALNRLRSGATGKATLRWTDQGFQLPSNDGRAGRNLLGVPDGTANPSAGPARDNLVWASSAGEPSWMVGGCYAVFRRIRLNLPRWMVTPVPGKDAAIGRRADGSPLSAPNGDFAATPDFKAKNASGGLAIPHGAHVREMNQFKMFRRGYNYDRGYDAGLLFMSFNREPDQFIAAQQHLARHDTLGTQFMESIGSGIYAVRGGVSAGGSLADGLF